MYERFYGLSRTPFAVTPDPAMLFMSKVHREALATIIYGVETRKGFVVCTGEVGTGKSTIVRAFFDQAEADAVKLIYIFTPQVTPFEMAQYICRELGLANPESVFAAVPVLQLKLLELFEAGQTVVLMIDEAQLLPPETLEFLRLLSNFETDTEKLIQIVLVGQPEVDDVLARQDMRQVSQRVALRARLAPLSIEESYDYIEHRLRVCGAGDLQQVMSQSAAWLIAEAAGGIPRRINILADNALIAGFGNAQRPLGSQIAGAAVNEFLSKSGAASPAPVQRFAAGWRAARRLRGALAREKGEPAEWEGATPLPKPEVATPAVRLGAPPLASEPARRIETPPARANFVAPRPPPAAVPRAATRREPAPAAAPPKPQTPHVPITVQKEEPAPAAALPEPQTPHVPITVQKVEPAPAAAPPKPETPHVPIAVTKEEPAPAAAAEPPQPPWEPPAVIVEPVIVEPVAPRATAPVREPAAAAPPVIAPAPKPLPVEAISASAAPSAAAGPFGAAVSVDTIVIVEPVAPVRRAAVPPSAAGRPAPVSVARPSVAAPRPPLVYAVNGNGRADLPAPRIYLTRQAAWPALSRVRSGLQMTAPRRTSEV